VNLEDDSYHTLQSHITNIIAKGTQVVLLKQFLYDLRHIAIRVFIRVIEHIHFNVELELVIFGEDCDDGNLKVVVLNTVMTVRDDAPF
jgi:hypothetical protein